MHLGTRPQTQLKLASILMLIACFFNALMGATVKYAYGSTTPEMMIFARNFVCLMLTLPWVSFSKLAFHGWKLQVTRGMSGLLSLLLYFYSLHTLSLSDASLLFNTLPIFAPIVAYLWRKKPIQHTLWWGIGIAFVGIIVVMRPGTEVLDISSILAILGAIFGAVASLALRYAHYTDPISHILFFYFLIASIIAGLMTLGQFEKNWIHFDVDNLKVLLTIGVLGMLWQVFFTMASKHAPVRFTSIFVYSTVIFSMMIDHWVWHREITLPMILGFLLIFLGAFLVVFLYKERTH